MCLEAEVRSAVLVVRAEPCRAWVCVGASMALSLLPQCLFWANFLESLVFASCAQGCAWARSGGPHGSAGREGRPHPQRFPQPRLDRRGRQAVRRHREALRAQRHARPAAHAAHGDDQGPGRVRQEKGRRSRSVVFFPRPRPPPSSPGARSSLLSRASTAWRASSATCPRSWR